MVYKKKKPLLAALLNAAIPGLGYFYVGRKKLFACLLLCGIIISIGGDIYYGLKIDVAANWYSPFAGLLIFFGFAYDAYSEAIYFNERV